MMMMMMMMMTMWGSRSHPSIPDTAPRLRAANSSLLKTIASRSPAWHRRARRKRAAARIYLRRYFTSGSPRSMRAAARIMQHHGSRLPKPAAGAIEMHWRCVSCGMDNWVANTHCRNCHKNAVSCTTTTRHGILSPVRDCCHASTGRRNSSYGTPTIPTRPIFRPVWLR